MNLGSDIERHLPVHSWHGSILKLLAAHAYQEAWQMCQGALAEHPQSPALLVSAASVLMKLDQAAEAERYAAQATALQPKSAVIWNNLGLALRNQNRIEEALRCFDRALLLDPDHARAHYDRAFSLLLAGDFGNGFQEYEHRWRANGHERPGDKEPGMGERLWGGENAAGQRVLLYAEQGLGDTIQFARYAAPLQARGVEVILEVQPALRGLMRWLLPACEVGEGNAGSEFDWHCPMMTLPLAFGTTPATVPPPAVFCIPEAMRKKWSAKLGVGIQLKVGLVWAGSPENPMDDRRSMHLRTFEALLSDQSLRGKISFFSFQAGVGATELGESPQRDFIRDLRSEATETAAALVHMDLVIAVDTFVAHLAASLGVTVWLLLAFAPDWRWLLEREDSLWYPSMRLFRQSAAGDWDGVVSRVREALLIYCKD